MLYLNSDKYTCIEMLVQSHTNAKGTVEVSLKDGKEEMVKEAGKSNYKLLKFPLEKNRDYKLTIKDCNVSYAYLRGNEDIFEEGVCFVEIDEEIQLYPKNRLKEFYDTPIREQFHFGPFKNWSNDPAGLCWFQGYYHMFYQANPNEQTWSNMYWGHAVSKDLTHWVHLPFAFYPQDELLEKPELKGGAFTGSALCKDNKMELYFTRHIGFIEEEKGTLQYQVSTASYDGINFDKENVIIEKQENMSFHFRDPKIQICEGKSYIVIGSKLNDIPCILLYVMDESLKWKYVGPLLYDKEEGIATIECPDLFQIGDKYVAVGGLMAHKDRFGRLQGTRYYIGNFDNNELQVENTGLYDFGSDFYAVQSFEHEGRRIAIGWISDFYGEHINRKNGAFGSMSIPRELTIEENKLYIKPVKEIYDLFHEEIAFTAKENILIENIKGNSYYAKIELEADDEFEIILGEDKNKRISLNREGKEVEIKMKGTKSESVHFVSEIKAIKKIEIFVDRRVVEVFINDGEAAGTKLFYNINYDGSFKTKFKNPENVNKIQVYTMKSIW